MKKTILSRRRALALSGGVMLASGVARAADEWPTKPVRYINVFPPGGPTDTLSRIVCHQLAEFTGQQFIVENKAGSGGNIGTDAIAKSAPDGYTIGLYTIASQAIAPTLYAKLPFDVEKDFTAIAMLWSVPNMLMTRLDLPAKTVPELIKLCQDNPGKYSFASSGSGTSPHLSGEIFKQLGKLNILHVPDRGSGLCGPAGMPPGVVEKLSALAKKALESEAVKAAFVQQGATAIWKSPADTAAYRAADEKRLSPVIKASGAKVD